MGLVEELDEKMLGDGHLPKRGKGKAMFLGQLDEIKAALDKGYSRAVIWKHLNSKGKMPVTYASFATYVYHFITAKAKENITDTTKKEGGKSASPPEHYGKPKSASTPFDAAILEPRRMNYNPEITDEDRKRLL